MIKIEVLSTEVNTKTVQRKTDGKSFTFHEQDAYAFVVDKDGKAQKYPVRMVVTLDDKQEPYRPGFYALAPATLYVDKFGALTVGRVTLQPLPASSAKAA